MSREMTPRHCGYCKTTDGKMYAQKGTQNINGKEYPVVFYKCVACNTKHKQESRYRKKSIYELEKLKIKTEKNLNILTSILSKKLSELGA